MEAKVLKHKYLEDTYGVFMDEDLCQCSLPQLFPITCTFEGLSHYVNDMVELLEYEMITVKIEKI